MSSKNYDVPRVGVGVLVFKDDKLILIKRKGSHGEGDWAAPGGHLEHMESFEDCARREVKEELGIEIKNIQFLTVLNVPNYAPKHFVDIGLRAEWASGEPKICEPEKADDLGLFDIDNLPEPLFWIDQMFLRAMKENKNYYDFE